MSEHPSQLLDSLEHLVHVHFSPNTAQERQRFFSLFNHPPTNNLGDIVDIFRKHEYDSLILRTLQHLDMLRHFPSTYLVRLFKVLLKIFEALVNAFYSNYWSSRATWSDADRLTMANFVYQVDGFVSINPRSCQSAYQELNVNNAFERVFLRAEQLVEVDLRGENETKDYLNDQFANNVVMRMFLSSMAACLGVTMAEPYLGSDVDAVAKVEDPLDRRNAFAAMLQAGTGGKLDDKRNNCKTWKGPGKDFLAVCLNCGTFKPGMEGYKQFRPCKTCACASYCGEHSPAPLLSLLMCCAGIECQRAGIVFHMSHNQAESCVQIGPPQEAMLQHQHGCLRVL